MSVLPSLCAALERAGGDRLILHEGERPHVLVGSDRHDVARAALTRAALEALMQEVLSDAGRRTLDASGTVVETVQAPGTTTALTARAERVDDELYLELRREPSPILTTPTPLPEEPAVQDGRSDVSLTVEGEPMQGAAPPAFTASAAPAAPGQTLAFVGTGLAGESSPATMPGRPGDLEHLLTRAASQGATTLYLRPGQPAAARLNERIEPLGPDLVDVSLVEGLSAAFEAGGNGLWCPGPDGQWIREAAEFGQVTCQLFTDHLGRGLVVRIEQRQSSEQLHRHIPRQVRGACDGDGLIVVSAVTDAEMLTAASAVADWAGRRRSGYVVVLTPSGATRHDIAGAFVSQRELGGDPAATIRRAVTESPDILVIASPQPGEAMQEALEAATSSRLVIIGTVTQTTTAALRLIAAGSTPQAEAHNRAALARTFRAGFTHRMLRRLGGGLTHVHDLLVGTVDVSALLAKGDFSGLQRLQDRGADGMRTVDHALARAVMRRQLTLRQASAHALDRQHLVALVRAARRGSVAAPAGRSRVDALETHISLDDERILAGMSARP